MFDHFSTLYMKGLNYFSTEPEAISIIWTAQTSKLIIDNFQTTKASAKILAIEMSTKKSF